MPGRSGSTQLPSAGPAPESGPTPTKACKFFGTVVAVRAPSAGLTLGPDADPADLRLGAPPREIKHFGDVECLVINVQTVVQGQQADPQRQSTTQCRRSNSAVTVEVFGNAMGPAQQKLIIALTEAAFASVSGGG